VQEPISPVTGPEPGAPERGTGAPPRSTGTQGAVGAVLITLALGLALRLILLYLLPGSGFDADLVSFRFWADDLARNGLAGFYQRDFFHDYTPGYMYVLWVVGSVGRALGGIGDLIKIPPILADLGLGYLTWSMIRELGGRERLALLGALVVMINPVFWFDSVVWGQVDSVGVLFLMLGLRALWRDQPERAAIFTVIAAIVKPQLGILIPIVAIVTIRRAIRPAASARDEPARAAAPTDGRLARWEARTDHPVRILTTGLAGYLTALVLCLPFGLTVLELTPQAPFLASGLVDQIAIAGGGYPYLTVNAYNAWALVQSDLGVSLANGGQWVCDAASIPAERCGAGFAQFGAVPAVVAGAAVLILVIVSVLWAVWRRPDRLTILVGVAVLAIAFFAAPTRVHERYGFPFFAIGAILLAISPRWRFAYVVLAVATFANMYVVLTTIYPPKDPGLNPVRDWLAIGPLIRSELGVIAISLMHTLAFAWAWLQLRPAARRRLDDELAAASTAPDIPDAIPDRPRPMIEPGGAVALAPAPVVMPTWSEPDRFDEIGARAWLGDRLGAAPVRADRSRTLASERGGRLDRLDVWLLVVVILGTLGIRLFRLAEPYQMHFDEVYHARTATEFLQAWRYGDSHTIYEWTHPHLAKYVMAGGLVLWGGDHVEATGRLEDPVRAAAIEHRRDDPAVGRTGERLHIATGQEVRTEDLRTRRTVARFDAPGVSALAIDPSQPRLVLGSDDGAISTVELDLIGPGASDGGIEPVHLASTAHPVEHLLVTDEGTILAASDLEVTAIDGVTGAILGTAEFAGIADLSTAGSGPVVRGDPALIEDPGAVADVLVELIGGDPLDYESRIANAEPDALVVFGSPGDDETRSEIDAAIADGRLAGLEIVDQPRAAVATSEGVSFIDPSNADTSSTIAMDGGAHGLGLVTGLDDTKLYVTTGSAADPEYRVVVVSGEDAADGPEDKGGHPLPGLGSRVAYDPASQQVHILGRAPGSAADAASSGWTVYVIEPHANAVYADAALPDGFDPVAWAMDVEPEYQADDRQQLLVLDAAGATASIDVGSHAFAWRLPGVIAGVLMAACLYLLARILFARRSVAIAVGGLAMVEGMFFVQSRIGMNDAYVGLFIVAAYTVFAAVWTGWWRGRAAFWLAMPLIGVLLGLALASKWVAAYAIGALVLLLLIRSALGRVVAILGLIALTGVLGYMAMAVEAGQGFGNLPFLVIMIGLTLLAVVVAIFHPIAWTDEEMWLALIAPSAVGAVLFFGALTVGRLDEPIVIGPVSVTPLLAAIAAALTSVAVYLAFRLGGILGYGPLKPPPGRDDPQRYLDPPDPAPTGWLRPGWLLGLPLVWATVCLVAIPLGLYVVSYLPWTAIENHRLWEGFPAEHSGQTLVELTRSMYDYHNGLTSPHPASSPWWAFPFDLKPVWFFQEGFAGDTSAAIYDSGNLVIWWLGIVGLVFVAIMAYRRRSPALALIAIGFAAQWVPWARIDRAAFQYHYYTALPFVILALAYLVAELWHGPSRRTWLAVRLAGALAVVAPAAMWLFSRPLCWLAGVSIANPTSPACPAVIPDFVLTYRTAALLIVVVVGAIALARGIGALQRSTEVDDGRSRETMRGVLLAATVVAVGLAATAFVPDTPILTWRGIPVEPIALLVTLPLLYLAGQVIAARDARRFVLGLGVAAVAWFVVWYPNLAALPLPSTVVNAYQGFLPTYLYAFQFPVNTLQRPTVSLVSPVLLALTLAIAATCLVVAYSASVWRLALAESRAMAGSGGGRGAGGSVASSGSEEDTTGLARTGGGA
jgi:hypothetical protein